MGKQLNRLLLFIFIGGLTWTALSDWLISYWGAGCADWQLETLRSINDVACFGLILLILYRQIRRQQRSLSASEAQYRMLFAANPNPMWIYDLETLRFVMVNDACLEKYGYSRSEFLQLSIFDIRPAAEHERLQQMLDKPVVTVRQAGIWRHKKADGSEVIMSVTSHPLQFDGRYCKLVMATDVTELMEKKARLKESNEALLKIAWSHSHELRKPLCSILAMLPLLRDPELADEQEKLLEMLEVCANELDHSLQRNSETITRIGNVDA